MRFASFCVWSSTNPRKSFSFSLLGFFSVSSEDKKQRRRTIQIHSHEQTKQIDGKKKKKKKKKEKQNEIDLALVLCVSRISIQTNHARVQFASRIFTICFWRMRHADALNLLNDNYGYSKDRKETANRSIRSLIVVFLLREQQWHLRLIPFRSMPFYDLFQRI